MNFLKGKSKGDVVFTIYRDSGEDAFLNRVAKDKATDEIKYVCKAERKTLHLSVCKGGHDGPVIASAVQNREKGGVTKIKMDSGESLLMKHASSLFSSDETFFEIDGKKVHWKGLSALVEDGTGVCLAVYKAKSWESKDRKLGTLLVTEHGVPYMDAIVSSALVKQERTDEEEMEKLWKGPENATTGMLYVPA